MAWGSSNEYMIFPIIDMIRREVRNLIERGDITQESFVSNNTSPNVLIQKNEETNKIEYNTNLMSRLQSNDFDLTLEKNDPENPNRLTGVILDYGEDLRQTINLLRENGKLAFVKMSIVLKEPIENAFSNPFGMSGDDFVEYLINKRVWTYYRAIYDDEQSTQEEKDNAESKMTLLEIRNQELRNLYGVTIDLPYEELLNYVPNPLGMTQYDYVEYVHNKWIWISTHPDITQEIIDQAAADNQALRDKYGITEDVGTYEEYAEFLPNPLGMHTIDFIKYMRLREEYINLDPNNPDDAARMPVNEAERQALLDSYYIEEDTYTYEELTAFLPEEGTLYQEKVLFRVMISLIYNKESGKLEKVKSETQEGE